jgi:hypothetical protein
MRMFLLKQMEQFTKNAVATATTDLYKPSKLTSLMIALAAAVAMSPAYAGVQLSDAELDNGFVEVQIRQICMLEKEYVDTKKSAYITEDSKPAKYTCKTDDLFVSAIKNDGNADLIKLKSASDKPSDSAEAVDSSSLLAGILQNLRSLGGGEFLGVPTGVSNTGNPIGFGSEQYSNKWSGNLSDIFRPIYAGGVIAPFSVYDQSELGFGFRAEAHFPYQLPQPKIQAFDGN